MNSHYDIAIVGSGFAGSLFAMIARRVGRSVILIERGSHPRFAIGESSTPLANLLLEELAVRYDLPRLLPLSKWGTWQRTYPEIAVGLKRGFSFYRHRRGERFRSTPDRSNELLVAASPHDGIGDTHWYRPEFDQFLVGEAQSLGVEYLERVNLEQADIRRKSICLRGRCRAEPIEIEADFVVDASGPRGFLQRALSLPERSFSNYPATESLYAHFRNVKRMDSGGDFLDNGASPPFPPDDAAAHHVFDGGWVWVLRFNNGITSAGVACTPAVARRLQLAEGEAPWERLLAEMPSLAELFRDAQPTTRFTHAPRLPFRTGAAAGERWAMLPSAAGVVDPLLSTGFPLTLLGITRLARIIDETWSRPAEMRQRIDDYADQSLTELDAVARLVGTLYANMHDFPLFSRLSLLYFAAASFSETIRRLGHDAHAGSFLLYNDPRFGPALRRCCEDATARGADSVGRDKLMEQVIKSIAPIDVAGLADLSRRNWYPVKAEDLILASGKMNATPGEISELLARCGFEPRKF